MVDLNYRVIVKDSPDKNDVRHIQGKWLWEYNFSQTHDSYNATLVIHLCDSNGEIVGGLLGEYLWNWLHISNISMIPSIRRKGFGTMMIRSAEDDALKRGYHNIYLETFSFQARSFYERLGYEMFGFLDDFPIGHQKFFMRKTLANI